MEPNALFEKLIARYEAEIESLKAEISLKSDEYNLQIDSLNEARQEIKQLWNIVGHARYAVGHSLGVLNQCIAEGSTPSDASVKNVAAKADKIDELCSGLVALVEEGD